MARWFRLCPVFQSTLDHATSLENQMAQELTQEYLKKLLHYDPETGVFTRLVRTSNCVNVGDVAGSTTTEGYLTIWMCGRQNLAHRLAWLYVYGKMPEWKLDHRDRDKSNNRISNLRPATNSQNGLNAGLRADNTSGHKGVSWNNQRQKWQARIMVDSKVHNLALRTNIEDAIAARKEAEIALGISDFCPQ